MSLGFSAFDAQQAPALSKDKRLYSTDTVAGAHNPAVVRAVFFFKASNSEENYKTVNWGFNVNF